MKITATFLGLSIGDALGVPVEFMSRERIAQNPVTTMRGFGQKRCDYPFGKSLGKIR